MTVAHRLAQRHDVRDHTVYLMAPHARTKATEARLHFVGNKQASGIVHMPYRLPQIANRYRRKSLGRESSAIEESRQLDALRRQFADCELHVKSVCKREFLIVSPGSVTVRVHDRNDSNVRAALLRRRHEGAKLHKGG